MANANIGVRDRYRILYLGFVCQFLLFFSCLARPQASLFSFEPETGTWLRYGDTQVLLRDFDPGQTALAMVTSSVLSLLPVGSIQAMRLMSGSARKVHHIHIRDGYTRESVHSEHTHTNRSSSDLSTLAGWGGNILGMLGYYLMHQGIYSKVPANRSEYLLGESSYLAPIQLVGELASRLRLSLYRYGNDWPMLDLSYLPGSNVEHQNFDINEKNLNQVAHHMGVSGIKRIQIRLSGHKEYVQLLISTLGEADEWKNFIMPLAGSQPWNITDILRLAAWMLTPKVMNAVIHGAMPVRQNGLKEGEVVLNSSLFTVRQSRNYNDFHLEPKSEYMLQAPDPHSCFGLETFTSIDRQVWVTGKCSNNTDPLCSGIMTLSDSDPLWPINHNSRNPASTLHYITGSLRIDEIDYLLSSKAGQLPYYEVPNWAIHTALIPVQIGLNYLLYRVVDGATSTLIKAVDSFTGEQNQLEQNEQVEFENKKKMKKGGKHKSKIHKAKSKHESKSNKKRKVKVSEANDNHSQQNTKRKTRREELNDIWQRGIMPDLGVDESCPICAENFSSDRTRRISLANCCGCTTHQSCLRRWHEAEDQNNESTIEIYRRWGLAEHEIPRRRTCPSCRAVNPAYIFNGTLPTFDDEQ